MNGKAISITALAAAGLLIVGATSGAAATKGAGSDGLRAAARPAAVEAPTTDSSLSFEPNRGQADGAIDYVTRGDGYSVSLHRGGAVLALGAEGRTVPMAMRLTGANSSARPAAAGRRPGVSNYLKGTDASKWVTGVPTFERVSYRGVYDGIDLVYYGREGSLEYDFVVAPGADPSEIGVRWPRSDALTSDARGNLVVTRDGVSLVQHRPVAFQTINGRRTPVAAGYVVGARGTVGFRLGDYDPARPLTIDPVLTYSSYLGGSETETSFGLEVDETGAAYLIGRTASPDFPTLSAFDDELGSPDDRGDVFLTKVSPDGSSMVYSTYIGGAEVDAGSSIHVKPEGAVYVGGFTCSPDFPRRHAYQKRLGGKCDGFVTKLGRDGTTLKFSTYVGGGKIDRVDGLDLGSSGDVYIAGETNSDNHPVRSYIQGEYGGGLRDAWAGKLRDDGRKLLWYTYLGGKKTDRARGLVVDGDNRAIVTGFTESSNFPVKRAYQKKKKGPKGGENFKPFDTFVSVISRGGKELKWSTYLGSSKGDAAFAVGVNDRGSPIIAGRSKGDDFPTTRGVFQRHTGGGPEGDSIVSRFSRSGQKLKYSTYVGGTGFDRAFEIAVQSGGAATLVGRTDSLDFPLVDPIQAVYGGGFEDAWIGRLTKDGSDMTYISYFGGEGPDRSLGVDVDEDGNAWFSGQAGSVVFPVLNPFQPTMAGGYSDAFVAHILLP